MLFFWHNGCLAGQFIGFTNAISCPSRPVLLQYQFLLDSLKVDGATYEGYSYSYNPCHPFKLGPGNGGCALKAGVAVRY